eukprot:TRINITY_DN14872_c0_g1_i2.p1 TRINITY_DN14872_c0_g1~~TRINITY_DN14872_c0_g1_i2.p1  ORF type:complete len:114 (+),score=10.60 TRINITY_DN14872_c0_g1_i2:482-823(+)
MQGCSQKLAANVGVGAVRHQQRRCFVVLYAGGKVQCGLAFRVGVVHLDLRFQQCLHHSTMLRLLRILLEKAHVLQPSVCLCRTCTHLFVAHVESILSVQPDELQHFQVLLFCG